MTITNRSGDGASDTFLDTLIVLPDAGSSVTVSGVVQAVGGTRQTITGSPLTAPSVPGSGSTFWNIQVDTETGAASVQQSSSADPAPIPNASGDGTLQMVIFRQTLTSSSSAQLTADTSTTPDQPI